MNITTQNITDRIINQTFGCEVEMYGITRERAAKVIGKFFGTDPIHAGGAYDAWGAKDQEGRTWKVVYDSSIDARTHSTKCELVTPVLTYDDMDVLQELLRKLRKAGAKADPSHQCGIHIHIGATDMNAHQILMLTNLMASHEDILSKFIGIAPQRVHWCAPIDERFVAEMNAHKPASLEEVKHIWYRVNAPSSNPREHYNPSRYHMLNLHALFTKGTVEFRMFQFDDPTEDRQGGIHAGQLKAYIQLCLGMCARAKVAKRTFAHAPAVQKEDPVRAMKAWLKHLGLVGPTFATIRHHMTERLSRASL